MLSDGLYNTRPPTRPYTSHTQVARLTFPAGFKRRVLESKGGGGVGVGGGEQDQPTRSKRPVGELYALKNLC